MGVLDGDPLAFPDLVVARPALARDRGLPDTARRPAHRPARPRADRAVGHRGAAAAGRRRPGARRLPAAVRRQRAAPARGRPPRLRGQRLPRAQDPGRGADPAGRGDPGRRRRAADGRPLRRAHPARGQPAGQAGRRADRAVARAGRRPDARGRRGRGRRRSSPRRSSAPASPPSRPRSRVTSSCAPGLHVRGNEAQLATAVANLVDNAIAYSGSGTRVAVSARGRRSDRRRPADRRHRGHRPGHRHRRGRPRADLRALLPRRPRALARHRRHRASGWPSSRTSSPTTSAASRCGARTGRGRRSPSGYRAFAMPILGIVGRRATDVGRPPDHARRTTARQRQRSDENA